MDRTPTLRIGEKLGRFEITDVLPAGGMGEVYRAKDPALQRDVAIKLLLRSEPHDLDRFRREAQTAAGFSHPNIVSIFEFGTEQRGDQSLPYLVMEFIEGASLRARLGATKEQLLRWLTDVARGLAALHQHGVVHRDLKPENIMIGIDDRARIVDFGLAKADGTTITTTGTIMGTVDYFSPEQAAGRRLDYHTDIFSFGIVLYEALTGNHPFRAASVPETIRRIHYESPDHLPGRLGEIVARCLRKDPRDRYLDAADIAHDLEEQRQPTPKPKAVPVRTVDPDATTIKVPPVRATFVRWRLITLATLLLVGMIALYRQSQPPNAAQRSQAAPTAAAQAAPTTVAGGEAALLPTCGLTGSPGKIKYGESARLRWSSSNATDVVISPDIGIVGPNGSIEVSPHANTTYEIVATSATGVAARGSVTIEVTNPPAGAKWVPVAGSIGATPNTISRGGHTLLQWNSFGATRVLITPSVGIVPLKGRLSVAPRSTTTYTLFITNDAGGYGTGTATVHVLDADTTVPALPSPGAGITCGTATQPGVGGTVITGSSSCSVPGDVRVTRATLSYTLDDGGEIAINGSNVFMTAPGSGPRDGTVSLPVDLFTPGTSFLLKVTARNAMNPDGTPVGEVFGKATVRLATTQPMAGVEIGVSPPLISKGGTAYLNWSSVDATAVVINPSIGVVARKGNMTIAPTETTTYTINGISASGDPARASVTLRVQ